jgi:hypothetical protein
VAGRVGSGRPLDSALAASAAVALLRRALAACDTESALARVGERFALLRLDCLCWRPGDEAAELWQCAGSAPPSRRRVPLPLRAALALHSFEGEAAATIDRYVSAFADLSPAELLEDLAAALPPGASGSLLVLGPTRENAS